MELPPHTYRCLCGGGMHVETFQAGRLVRCPRCRDIVIVPTERGELARAPEFSLRTGRLELRLATRKDWKDVHAVLSDERNYEYELSSPNTERQTKTAIRKASFPGGFRRSGTLRYCIRTRSDLRSIGTLTLSFRLPYYCAELGFMITGDERGKGYGTEAVSSVCGLLLGELGVEKVVSMCDSRNRACRALLEKAGFTQEGLFRRFYHHPKRGWIDSPVYALLRRRPDDDHAATGDAG